MARHKVLNTPAVRRMPSYLHKLILKAAAGEKVATTTEFAQYFNVDSIVVRKDFELTGAKGASGIGYDTEELLEAIRHYLGWDRVQTACLVGAGSLGTALLGYPDFREYGLQITDVFDSDPAKIGRSVHGQTVQDVATMEAKYAAGTPPRIAIICVNSPYAQEVTDLLVKCGVTAIWNFANVALRVPPNVIVQREVIAGGLAVLSMKLKTHQPPSA